MRLQGQRTGLYDYCPAFRPANHLTLADVFSNEVPLLSLLLSRQGRLAGGPVSQSEPSALGVRTGVCARRKPAHTATPDLGGSSALLDLQHPRGFVNHAFFVLEG